MLQSVDTGDQPGGPETARSPPPGRTASRSRASRATSATSRSRSSRPPAPLRRRRPGGGRADRQGLGPVTARNQVMAEFRNPGAANQALQHRGQRQADRCLPRHRRLRRAHLDGQASHRRDQRPSPRPRRSCSATSYRNNAATGIVQPRARVSTSATSCSAPRERHLVARSSSTCTGSARTATAPSRAYSSSASSTLASGRPA